MTKNFELARFAQHLTISSQNATLKTALRKQSDLLSSQQSCILSLELDLVSYKCKYAALLEIVKNTSLLLNNALEMNDSFVFMESPGLPKEREKPIVPDAAYLSPINEGSFDQSIPPQTPSGSLKTPAQELGTNHGQMPLQSIDQKGLVLY